MNIYQRINKVMQEVKYVKKDTVIDNKYSAVTHDQVLSVARQSLIDNGIVVYPYQIGESQISAIFKTTGEPTNIIRFSATYDVNFVNIDAPEDKVILRIEAHANDNGDKAPGKALTYATKSAILKILALETGINDESREEVKEKARRLTELPKDIEDQIQGCETMRELSDLWKTVHKKDRADELTGLCIDTMRLFVDNVESIEELNQIWTDTYYGWRDTLKPYFKAKKDVFMDAGETDPLTGYKKVTL